MSPIKLIILRPLDAEIIYRDGEAHHHLGDGLVKPLLLRAA